MCLSGQAEASASDSEAEAEAEVGAGVESGDAELGSQHGGEAEAEAEAEDAQTADSVAAEERHIGHDIPAEHLVVGALVVGSFSDGKSYPGTISSIAAGKNVCFTVKYDDGTPDEKYTLNTQRRSSGMMLIAKREVIPPQCLGI